MIRIKPTKTFNLSLLLGIKNKNNDNNITIVEPKIERTKRIRINKPKLSKNLAKALASFNVFLSKSSDLLFYSNIFNVSWK